MIDREENILKAYKKVERKKLVFLFLAFIFLIVISLKCTALGITDSTAGDIFKALTKMFVRNSDFTTQEKVLVNLRMPRTLLALLAGTGLAMSGLIMQGLTRNPLVSPFTIGVSSAAGFGASVAIVFSFGLFGSSQIGIVTNAFIAAIICTLIIFLIASKMEMNSQSIILTGIALNYLFSALSTSIQFIADDNKLAKVINWTFGSLNGATWDQVKVVAAFVIPCLIFACFLSEKLTVISLMEDELAKTMGINPAALRMTGSALAALSTSAIISFTGVIGFVGLAAPHIARALVGNNYKYLLPATVLVGANLLIIADTIGRLILSPIIIPVGIVISFIGVPIFLHQVVLTRRSY